VSCYFEKNAEDGTLKPITVASDGHNVVQMPVIAAEFITANNNSQVAMEQEHEE